MINRKSRFSEFVIRLAFSLALAVFLSACQGGIDSMFPKAEAPIPEHLVKKMKAKGMTASSPILLRIYKTENVIEVWKAKNTGRYDLLETYEICKWSGKLGPKFKEGDRQAPEGFYTVGKGQLNPNSDYHLSFNIGYPNTFDRSHGRTGTHLMVHGACSSAGCYSMTDELVEEIYALARDAIKGGQDYFQVQAYPFRMTAENLAKHAASEHFEFWKMLKEGSDFFELTNYPPKVDVCDGRYVFNRVAVDDKPFSSRKACPAVTMPEKLLVAYSDFLKDEKVDFQKALKREKLKAERKGEALAGLDIERISMIAAGSEVLPPPTPVAPVIAEAPTAPTGVDNTSTATNSSSTTIASDGTLPPSITDGQTTEPAATETVTAIAVPTPSPINNADTAPTAAATPVDAPAVSGTAPQVATQGVETVTDDPLRSTIPVPQSPEREAVAQAPEEPKLPWWKRLQNQAKTSSGS